MTSAAVSSVCKLITHNLLAALDEHLVIASLCRRDYERSARYNNDALLVPVDPANPGLGLVSFRLRLETASIHIADVADVIMHPAQLGPECLRVAGQLASTIERELLAALAEFPAVVSPHHNGITPASLDEADRILFDAGASAPGWLITGDYGWNQITTGCGGKVGALEVCSPSPDDEPYLATSAVVAPGALCLITRRLLQTTPVHTAHAERDDLGFTLTALEGPDGKSLVIGIHLLFAGGIVRGSLGVRIPVPAAGLLRVARPAIPAIPATPSTAPDGVLADPCPGEPRLALEAVTSDPVVARFSGTLDSLAESIPEHHRRLAAALRLLARTDGITTGQLLGACASQLAALASRADDWDRYMLDQRRAEITSREFTIHAIDGEIAAFEQRIAELRDRRAVVTAEMAAEGARLDGRARAFAAALEVASAAIHGMERMLTRTRTIAGAGHAGD